MLVPAYVTAELAERDYPADGAIAQVIDEDGGRWFFQAADGEWGQLAYGAAPEEPGPLLKWSV